MRVRAARAEESSVRPMQDKKAKAQAPSEPEDLEQDEEEDDEEDEMLRFSGDEGIPSPGAPVLPPLLGPLSNA